MTALLTISLFSAFFLSATQAYLDPIFHEMTEKLINKLAVSAIFSGVGIWLAHVHGIENMLLTFFGSIFLSSLLVVFGAAVARWQ